jgi:hypothetical protein
MHLPQEAEVAMSAAQELSKSLARCALLAWLGCGCLAPEASTPSMDDDRAEKTALHVQALGLESDDITAMRFELVPVSCDDGSVIGMPIEEVRSLSESSTVPGKIAELQDAPFDKDAAHRISDLFAVVPAGCYDVTITPLGADDMPSERCGTAKRDGVEVIEGQTTEVLLVSQCQGTDPGALDILAALNHAPEITDLGTPDDADFACGKPVQLCATARDVDSDPLELLLEGPDTCEIVADAPAASQRCWTLTCRAGVAPLTLRVFDLIWRDGELVHIEDWFAEEGRDTTSHAEAAFELHFIGTLLWRDGDGDGRGDASDPGTTTCEGDDTHGLVPSHDDCDDTDPRVLPGAPEICGDLRDNDCDGSQDEACAACSKTFACSPAGPAPEARCVQCADATRASYCFHVAEGGRICSDDFWCAGKTTCLSSQDCTLSEVCVVDTCCGRSGVCAPVKLECTLDDAGVSAQAMSSLGTATGGR